MSQPPHPGPPPPPDAGRSGTDEIHDGLPPAPPEQPGGARRARRGLVLAGAATGALVLWTAVPSDVAPRIAEEVRWVWLPRGSAWAAEAPRRGNARSAAEHRWLLVYEDGHPRAVET